MPNVEYRRAYLKLHFIIFIWGFTAVLGALISLDALPLTWYRLAVAWVSLGVWLAFKGRLRLPARARDLARFAFTGFLIGLHWTFFFLAIKKAGVSVTLVSLSASAFFASLLEPLVYRRRVYAYEVAAGLAVVAVMAWVFHISGVDWAGAAYGLAAAFFGAFFSVWNGKWISRYDAALMSFYELVFAWMLVSLFVWKAGAFVPPSDISSEDWIWLLLLGTVCTAYAFTASLEVMRRISPFTLILSVNLEPVYGIILA
ncbi:MAG: DMT family transporter, partial [Chlorobi bacterium]|nr:DMT family transporter [Chlorobiota bacterium]